MVNLARRSLDLCGIEVAGVGLVLSAMRTLRWLPKALVRSILNSQMKTPISGLRPVIEQMLVEMGLIECASQFDLCILVNQNAYVIYDFNYHGQGGH